MAKNKKKKNKKKIARLRVYRDAATGRFVTKKFAKKHPKTTVKESRPGESTSPANALR